MWSRFLGEKGIRNYTNEELLEYRVALIKYKQEILNHCKAWVAEKNRLDVALQDRLGKLESAALDAEEDRMNCDVNYWNAQTWIH